MIRLDKEIVISDKKEDDGVKKNVIDQKEATLFAQKVIKRMQKDEIVPTPHNFQIYFDTLLDSADKNFKDNVESIRQTETDANDSEEHYIQMEKDIKESSGMVKIMVQSVAVSYKNILSVKNIIKKRIVELNGTTNSLTIANSLAALERDIQNFDNAIEQHLSSLKEQYEKTITSIKSIENEAVFDTRYNIYNKKYLLTSIENEKESIRQHNHSCSLMLVKVKDDLLASIPNKRDKILLVKNIAKLLQRSSRRSDVIAHYGEGIFAMLMKHTNFEAAKKACNRVAELVYNSSFFIGEDDININIEIAAGALNADDTLEESLADVLDLLPRTSRDGHRFLLVNKDEK